MGVAELTTLCIALAALITSVISVLEMQKQRENDVRPVLVLLEKRLDKKREGSPFGLYLVNMGQAVAIKVEVKWTEPDVSGAQKPQRLQTEVFPGRRAELLRAYTESCLAQLRVFVSYSDVNEKSYTTAYLPGEGGRGEHVFGRGKGGAPTDLAPYVPGDAPLIEAGDEGTDVQTEMLEVLRAIRERLDRSGGR